MILEAVFNSWKIIIDVYRELLTSEPIEVEEYSEEYDKQLDILKKINPGGMILTKQNQLLLYRVKYSFERIKYSFMDWLIESWLYRQLKRMVLFLIKVLRKLNE